MTRSSPSAAAKSTQYNTIQGSDAHLLDGRFNKTAAGDGTSAPPIELYHPVFSAYNKRANDLDIELPEGVLRDSAKLLRNLSAISVAEFTRDSESRLILASILNTSLDTLSNHDKTSSDYMVSQKTPMDVSAAVTIVEVKAEMGTGGSDPSVQVSFSFDRFYCQSEVSQLETRSSSSSRLFSPSQRAPIRDACCCPAFLVGLAGPWLVVMGAVMTSQTVVQRLSAYEWLGCSRVLDDAQVFAIARRLYALRLAIKDLEAYYQFLSTPTVRVGHIHPRFCPFITFFMDNANR